MIDRHGRVGLRRILSLCAGSAMRWDAQMQRFAARLQARGKPLKVVQVAAMRKLLHLVYGVWKHEADYDPTLAFPEVA